ncbi:hypothetical protein [Lignipirellula cremea]|uniref:Leucine Rich repeats (2 copies) n=1 Tax=Lignipirellula cremea TaxID=2528010 RepID=A0A518DKQ6_9BACT|nr:hypothetical protein [Lignipirellula cremea]QDU92415.1 hypothetical protein Pla8534_01630 [Lignipirellula cremea]
MIRIFFLTMALTLGAQPLLRAELPNDEAGAIAYLSSKGVKITTDDGHAVRLMSSGSPALSAEEYQLIGLLTHLEQMGINGAPLADDEWGFLKSLRRLKQLSIWHSKGFAALEPFSGLPVESLTIGGCMGLRDLNKDKPEHLRDAITTLHDLPRLKRGNWYHSPLAPDDSHLAHIAREFPQLECLRLDFHAPRGSETSITPEGLARLQALPLKVLSIENAGGFSTKHLAAIAGVKTLQSLLVDARKQPAPTEALAAFRKLRPDVEVVVASPDAKRPPRARQK